MIPKQLLARNDIDRVGQKCYYDGNDDDNHHKS